MGMIAVVVESHGVLFTLLGAAELSVKCDPALGIVTPDFAGLPI